MGTNLRNRICFAPNFKQNPIKRFLIIVIGLLITTGAYAQSINQNVTVKGNQIALKDFLKQIEKQSEYTFVYRDIILDDNKDISVDAINKPLNEVLSQVLSGKNLDYKITNKTIVLIQKEATSDDKYAQARKISGIVNDDLGDPLIGVSVSVKGTTIGTITDIDGRYSIDAPENGSLIFSYIGFEKKELAVKSQSKIDIILSEDMNLLDEVVVVGYGIVKKKDLTGSLTSVGGEKLVEANKTSAAAALQGSIAGVDIVRKGNKPGAGFDIMIRGQNTIASEQTSDNKTDLSGINPPLYVVDGMFLDNINDISPDDIERIDVLKDASSTAIYGSRGANGVVIVTTKRGTEGKSYVEYNGYVSFANATNLPDMMNANEWAQYRLDRYIGSNWDSYDGRGLDQILSTQQYKNYQAGKDVDWVDALFKTAVSHNHSVRIYGNAKGLAYTFSGGYTDEKGVTGVDRYTRYNFSTRIDKEISSKLKAGINIYATYTTTVETPETVRQAYRLNPLSDMYNDDGSLRTFPIDGVSNVSNPLVEKENNQLDTRTLHAFGNIYLEYKPIDWIKFTTTLTPDAHFDRDGKYQGIESKTGRGNADNRRANYGTSNTVKYAWSNILTANKTFGDHAVNGMVGTEWLKETGDGASVEARGFASDLYEYFNLGVGQTWRDLKSYYTQEQWMSTFARANYTYKGKYMFTATGRYDGSSKLAEGHKWKFFPSAAFGWRISDEAFMKNVKAVDNLKLRLSYGVSGNNNSVSRYQTSANILNSYYVFGDDAPSVASAIEGLGNKSLTWETTKEFNVGLDFGFLGGRINGSIDVYNRRTDNIIMERALSAMNGYVKAIDNVGKVDNKGIEISLSTVNVKAGDFTWTSNFNFTTNKNEIVELSDGSDRDEANGWFVGESVGAVWTYKPIGFWGMNEVTEAAKYGLVPGSVKVLEVDGNTTSTNADKVIRGSMFPKWTGGMTNTFRYKDIDLTVFVYTRQGQWSYSQFHRTTALDDNINFNKMKLNYWTPENTSATWHRPGINAGMTDALMYQKTSFTKVGYITLGYNMPKKITSQLGVNKLRVYGSCQNPFLWTDYKGWDPEAASLSTETGHVLTRSFLFGLNLTF